MELSKENFKVIYFEDTAVVDLLILARTILRGARPWFSSEVVENP